MTAPTLFKNVDDVAKIGTKLHDVAKIGTKLDDIPKIGTKLDDVDKPIFPRDRYNQNPSKNPSSTKPPLDLKGRRIIWDDPDPNYTKRIETATDNAARNAVKRAKELGYSGKAKREIILECTETIGYQKQKELRKRNIVISTIMVDTIIAVSVDQALDEDKNSEFNPE